MSGAQGSLLEPAIERTAILSPCARYRYLLTRAWPHRVGNPVTFIMLNPSTADAAIDDPTIRRCMNFAKSWGFLWLQVVNLFAVRSPNPKVLRELPDPVGPENHRYVRRALLNARAYEVTDAGAPSPVVCAWGAHGGYRGQDLTMLDWIAAADLHPWHLPRFEGDKRFNHPLYLRRDLEPRIWLEGA